MLGNFVSISDTSSADTSCIKNCQSEYHNGMSELLISEWTTWRNDMKDLNQKHKMVASGSGHQSL